MHGLGNDYVYVDCFRPAIAAIVGNTDVAALARRVSDRHRGIGADGLVLIQPSQKADAGMRIFNADGSEAQMCGNAIRCVGKYLYESRLCHRTHMQIETLSGIRALELDVMNDEVLQVTVEMGLPIVKTDTLDMDNMMVPFVSVNMGNPHAVFFRETGISDEELHHLGKAISAHTHFPEGTNVEFVSVSNQSELDMRVWERGSGETMACGTGACAATVAAIWQGLTAREVTVHLPGGDLDIHWETKSSPVYMTGAATEVFHGDYYLYN